MSFFQLKKHIRQKKQENLILEREKNQAIDRKAGMNM